jgi:hypothetical protein
MLPGTKEHSKGRGYDFCCTGRSWDNPIKGLIDVIPEARSQVQSSINVIGKQSTIENEHYSTRVIRIDVKGITVHLLVRTGTFNGVTLD